MKKWWLAALALAIALTGPVSAAVPSDESNQLPATDEETATLITSAVADAPASAGAGGEASGGAGQDEWRFSVTPLAIWAFGIEGPISLNGVTADANASFSDVKDKIDGGGGISFEFGKGSWTGFVSGSILKFLEEGVAVPSATVDLSLEITAVEAGLAYRLPVTPGPKAPRIELLGGARYNKFKGEINSTSGTPVNVSRDVNWTDPFFGLRLAQPFGGNWAYVARGDVGGFGVSSDNTSQLTWNFTTGFGYQWRYTGWGMSLFGGYKLNEIDYRRENTSEFQMIQRYQGPVMSLSFSW